ncbi:hypothetical protein GMMP1_930025 [Candidatus Magnetomoraceae bacterium gMMP-1]
MGRNILIGVILNHVKNAQTTEKS